MNIPGLSLCMIVRNEAAHLERCLSSVQGLVSEIILADTGSSDGSMDIARSFGARVIEIPWEHDFAKARNLTLRQASSPWILVLDADEAADSWEKHTLCRLLENTQVQGYFLPFVHYVGSTAGGEYVTDNVCRLFRNDKRIFFQGSIHEETASSIWALPEGQIAYADLPVSHYGYLEGELHSKDKASRNLALILAALQRDPQSHTLRYALGTEYYQQEQYSTAAEILLPLLNESPSAYGYAADIYLKTAYALQAAGHSQAAKTVYADGISLFPDFTDLLECYARLLLDEGALQESFRLLQEALKYGNMARKYPSSSGSGTSRTSLLAGQVCEQLFRYEEAKGHYGQTVQYAPGCTAAWEALVPLCLLSGDAERLTALTRSAGSSLPQDTLRVLVPAALNAHAGGWLGALAEAAQLPAAVRSVLQVLPDMFRQHEGLPAVAASLERLLPEHPPEKPFILGYLWAWSCRTGDAAAAERWLLSLAGYRPGLTAVAQLLRMPGEHPARPAGVQPPALADLAYAAQLLLQAGAWNSLLALYRNTEARMFQWSLLPLPVLSGLLLAPAYVRQQWCSIYTGQEHQYHMPAGPAEWLLYAAVASSCGMLPLLEPAAEQLLRQSGAGSKALLIGLGYHKLQLAAGAALEIMPTGSTRSGSIPWPLLVQSALRGD